MILPSTPLPTRTTVTPEHVLFGFSLRLHLLHRALLRAAARSWIPGGDASAGTTCAAEAVRDFHHDFVVFTRARLERPFAAMHGRELRRWEAHLAGILRRRDTGDAAGFRDLLDEMEAIAGDGEELLLHLRQRAAREMARMLLRYRRALAPSPHRGFPTGRGREDRLFAHRGNAGSSRLGGCPYSDSSRTRRKFRSGEEGVVAMSRDRSRGRHRIPVVARDRSRLRSEEGTKSPDLGFFPGDGGEAPRALIRISIRDVFRIPSLP